MQVLAAWLAEQHPGPAGPLFATRAGTPLSSDAVEHLVAELENELAIHRRAAELLGDVVPPKGATRRSR